MRVYMGDASTYALRKCRQRAPSHAYGRVWTPNHRRPGTPYIVDNGEYVAAKNGEEWSKEAWTDLLDTVAAHPWPPDFVVLPDVYNDAEATLERHREHIDEVLSRGLRPAAVIQPGMDETTQLRLAERIGAGVAFVGGENRWKRTMGQQMVADAHDLGLAVHIGNPGVPGGLEWAVRIGADSVDTSSIVASEAWHHLDELEQATPSNRGSLKKNRQTTLADGGVADIDRGTEGDS
jgi:hypothetical protein